MSTIKTDAIISVSTNGNLDLSGHGTGGVKVSDYLIQTKGSDISSATSLTLGKDGNLFDVTGTTTITSIGTQGIGSHVTLHFDGALTFTHHSTNLILPGAANITTAAGDIAVMYEYASADWRCVSYSKASGAPVATASTTVTGGSELATSAETITGSDTARTVTPAGLQAKVASATAKGIVELATDAETITGSDTARAVTPANIQAKVASATAKGIAELATTAETVTGTDTGRVVTPAGLHGALAGLTDTTITAADTVIFADATDSAALKEDTVQGILDLASGGKILQVARGVDSTERTTTSTSLVSSTFGVSLSSVESDSVIIITGTIGTGFSSAAGQHPWFAIRRGATSLLETNETSMMRAGWVAGTGSATAFQSRSITAWDTGHSGGSLTYNLYWKVASGTGYLNQYLGGEDTYSRLVVWEVGA